MDEVRESEVSIDDSTLERGSEVPDMYDEAYFDYLGTNYDNTIAEINRLHRQNQLDDTEYGRRIRQAETEYNQGLYHQMELYADEAMRADDPERYIEASRKREAFAKEQLEKLREQRRKEALQQMLNEQLEHERLAHEQLAAALSDQHYFDNENGNELVR